MLRSHVSYSYYLAMPWYVHFKSRYLYLFHGARPVPKFPCKHGGTCDISSDSSYEWICPRDLAGSLCQ